MLKHDSKVKIKYISEETNKLGTELVFEVKEDVVGKIFSAEYPVIKKGARGRIKITRLSGFRKDIVTDVEGQIEAVDGTEVDLVFYKAARKKLRKTLKAVSYIGLKDPIGILVKIAESNIRRKVNEYNLPSKLWVKDDLLIKLRA